MSESLETPRPPATPEFGAVTPGGPPHRYEEEGGARIVKRSVGDFDNNVYVVVCSASGEAVIIDGAADPALILDVTADTTVRAILQTHSHFDHVGALEVLTRKLGVPVLAHPEDAPGIPVPTDSIEDGAVIEVGRLRLEVLHTPGHSPGSLSFLLGRHLLSGDTLFPGGPGNTFGNPDAFRRIMASLDRLFALPDETRVSPGHGLDTTIGRERPFLETWRARGW